MQSATETEKTTSSKSTNFKGGLGARPDSIIDAINSELSSKKGSTKTIGFRDNLINVYIQWQIVV